MPDQRPNNSLDPDLERFLGCATPKAWLKTAEVSLDILLVDHANCEKKAASTALSLLYRYTDQTQLLFKLSQLAREELLHFEQVVALMQARNISYSHISPSRYAQKLHQAIRKHEPFKLIDTLLVGAFIEARSCERFFRLIPHVDSELGQYYRYLLKSESRHFLDYLALAKKAHIEANLDPEAFEQRIAVLTELEQQLITEPDTLFRFHSGPPALAEDSS